MIIKIEKKITGCQEFMTEGAVVKGVPRKGQHERFFWILLELFSESWLY